MDKKLFLHYGDVVDASSLNRMLDRIKPDEIYNLAAQSHVKVSFDVPDYTAQVDALATLRFLDAIKEVGLSGAKFYQASTSELFGKVQETPQTEKTPFHPRSPYGISKLFAYWTIVNYREAYGVFASNGILFNHESPRRGETFVTRKITLAAARMKCASKNKLFLGNLDAKRDWGYAPEYVEGMWQMLQLPKPDDFVIATGVTHSVREFADLAFRELDLELAWEGEGAHEKGRLKKSGEIVVEVAPSYFRPTEVDILQGDATKARESFGWQPKTTFEELVSLMVKADYDMVRRSLK
jgi:GDPmannose 4,6-dehydratase